MTVKKLIEELSVYHPDMIVEVQDEDGEYYPVETVTALYDSTLDSFSTVAIF